MTTRRLAFGLALLLGAACTKQPIPQRNVVLISIDTLRADRMSLYGAARRTTPSIEELASLGGVVFSRAYSPSPWTLPAHAALLTGRYPLSLASDASAQLYRLAPLLSSILKGNGYETAAVVGGGYVSRYFGADIGFDEFHRSGVDDAVRWLEGRHGAPFFLFFHTYAPHAPYRDRRYVAGADGGRLGVLFGRRRQQSRLREDQLVCGSIAWSAAERAYLLDLYDGGVAAADEMVGQLVAALRRSGLLEQTIVIVTSDHGEEFWDHGRAAFHGHTLYDELLRVPLVWYESELPRRKERNALVSLVDIVPTLLARLGLPAAPGVHGVDLSPVLEGRPWRDERVLVGEFVRHGPPRKTVLTISGKLIVSGGPTEKIGRKERCSLTALPRELYLPGDNEERDNRIAAEPELAARLASQLATALRAQAADTRKAEPALPAERDPATRKQLEALGYVD